MLYVMNQTSVFSVAPLERTTFISGRSDHNFLVLTSLSVQSHLLIIEEFLKISDFLSELKKKKSNKDSEAKNIQINFHCKVKELLQWRITGLNVNIMT